MSIHGTLHWSFEQNATFLVRLAEPHLLIRPRVSTSLWVTPTPIPRQSLLAEVQLSTLCPMGVDLTC